METISLPDFVTEYSKLTKEAIEEYAKKNNISSISAEDLKLLNSHVATYCLNKMTEQFLQGKELNNEAQIRTEFPKEEKDFEEEKCLEPAPIHQSLTGPSEPKDMLDLTKGESSAPELHPHMVHGTIRQTEVDKPQTGDPQCSIPRGPTFHAEKLNNEAETRSDALEEKKSFEQEKSMTPQPTYQLATDHFQIYMDSLMKLMTELHKQQQENQNAALKSFLDQLKHQHSQEEQSQQQQNRFQEQLLLQQQDFQTKLMGDFMKHSEMQTALLCQTLSQREQPNHDDHLNVDIKDAPYHESCSSNMTQNVNEYDNSFPGRSFAQKNESFSHFQVCKTEKKLVQFDCHKLGQEFCQWFFPLLNSQNSAHGEERLAWDHPHMFWNDAIFSIVYVNSKEQYTGDECVSSKLLEMTQKDKLIFTPTLDSKRFKCVNSRHGQVVVAVTGILSCTDTCSKVVFDQIFGLIKCPSTFKYKIKSMALKVYNMNSLNIGQTSHVPPLQYSTEQLQDFNM
ncbi:uncharacterized protein ACNLHF_009543 [Anomaloglossus baeobatrachus]|uniref:uncharacterized protein LOC142283211 n=1 Tax=Anomaloglossus baeobatrachus TaxID=238106 RepID=UPI003F504BA8